mgnify:CR=1 FL=1
MLITMAAARTTPSIGEPNQITPTTPSGGAENVNLLAAVVRLSDGSEYVVRGLCLSSDKAETFDLAILVNSEDVEVCVPTEDLLHWYEDGDEDEDDNDWDDANTDLEE